MPTSWPPAIGVSGKSGSGKTLLIERLVPRLTARGLRVAVVKHCTHRIEADTPGKDSDRLFRAGADVLAAGPNEAFARFHGGDAPLRQTVRRVGAGCDLCLVEGYRGEAIPRILVQRDEGAVPDTNADASLFTATDVPAQIDAVEAAVRDFAVQSHRLLPTMGLVLVGGRSRRMGRPKSLLADGAGSVLERIVAILKVHARRVLLAGRGPVPATLADLDRLMDVPSVEGPLAGILSAVRWHPSARWIVLACDLPLVEADAVQWLLSQTRLGADAVMPRLDPEAPCEPLFAVYEPTCLPRLEGAALEGTWSLRRALGGGRTLQPVVPTPLRSAWTNVNTLAEWEATRRSMDEGHCG